MKTLTLILFLMVTGCGDINGDINVGKEEEAKKEESLPTKPKWSVKDKATTMNECRKRALEEWSVNDSSFNEPAVGLSYCTCTLDETEKRWTIEEIEADKDGSLTTNAIREDGTIARCLAEAKTAPSEPEATETETTTGLISKGMSKENVERILGKPSLVRDRKIFVNDLEWVYLESPSEAKVCFKRYNFSNNECKVSFDEYGKMIDQEDVDAKWIQL